MSDFELLWRSLTFGWAAGAVVRLVPVAVGRLRR